MPLKDDLIERTLEGLARLLARALVGDAPAPAALAEAEDALDEAYRRHTGAGRLLTHQLGSTELIAILGSAGRIDREKAFLIGSLLHIEGQLLERRAGAVSPALRLKALDLFLEAALAGLDPSEVAGPVGDLLAALDGREIPAATSWRLFDYRVLGGGYAAAEDLLFALLDRFGPGEEVALRGRAFYRELAARSDAELEHGGLPRDEVEEGSQAFEGRLERAGRVR